MKPLLLGVFLVLFWYLYGPSVAELHHTGTNCGAASGSPTGEARCLPLMDRSWAVGELRASKSLTWCLNQRASTYPNLRVQVREVLANHEVALGLDWIEIGGTYETPTAALSAGCQVQMNMPAVHGCPECGGWIHYLNRPVLIEYNPHRGITLFQTTISHEVEHLYGVHEHYDDAKFLSHRNTYGRWAHGLNTSPGTSLDAPTVMDFGTGVHRLTAYDVKYVCQSIDRQSVIFTGCGAFQEPPTYPQWTGERWIYDEGGVANSWSWGPSPEPWGTWYFRNVALWDYCAPEWGGRHSPFGFWARLGTSVYFEGANVWSTAPTC